jgi:hypothetical protein
MPVLALRGEAGLTTMLKSNLQPPHDGLNADPVLYGVAAGLAELFPPVEQQGEGRRQRRGDREGGQEPPREGSAES